MNTTIDMTTAEAAIRELVEHWLNAVRAADIEGIMCHYAADIVAYDAVSQLQFNGVDAYRKHWQACLAMCPGAMIFEIDGLHVAADRNVAFSHALVRCGAVAENGEEKASWMRMTACYRELDGKWFIVHEHFSAPFDMQSGKALFDLRP